MNKIDLIYPAEQDANSRAAETLNEAAKPSDKPFEDTELGQIVDNVYQERLVEAEDGGWFGALAKLCRKT